MPKKLTTNCASLKVKRKTTGKFVRRRDIWGFTRGNREEEPAKSQ